MRKILVTGGTVFVSRYIAEYYVSQGEEVYVLNRNTKQQSEGVHLIAADRNRLKDELRHYYFDVVIDTAYTADEIRHLLHALGNYGDYIFISSSAVYPEYAPMPFREESPLAENRYWKKYGTDKIEAEQYLMQNDPHAYILRPPYLYGPMNNVYREAFVFECALANRKFYIPKDGMMQLQFFHIHDLCRFIDILLEKHPHFHIFNVGNNQLISIADWVKLCYEVCHKEVQLVCVEDDIDPRKYFSFYDYEYALDVSRQNELMSHLTPLKQGLEQSLTWYLKNASLVNKKPLISYIDDHFISR